MTATVNVFVCVWWREVICAGITILLQMEKGDKGSTLTRMGVSGWMFLLVPAYPGCPGQTAIKRLLLLCCCYYLVVVTQFNIYTVFQKMGDTKLMAVTLLSLKWFSKFFTVRFSSKCSKVFIKDPTAPHMRRYTTLWNINVRKWATVAN